MTQPLENGPYNPPALKIGDRVECLRRGRVFVVGFTSQARWPLVSRHVAKTPSVLVDDEFIRAMRSETTGALCDHFEISKPCLNTIRKEIGFRKDGESQ